MSKAISFLVGAWCCYCAMIGSYDGATALLLIYVLIAFDPLEPHEHKKVASAGDTDDQSKSC